MKLVLCSDPKKLLIGSDHFDLIQTGAILKFLNRSVDFDLSHVIVSIGHFKIQVTLSELVFRY